MTVKNVVFSHRVWSSRTYQNMVLSILILTCTQIIQSASIATELTNIVTTMNAIATQNPSIFAGAPSGGPVSLTGQEISNLTSIINAIATANPSFFIIKPTPGSQLMAQIEQAATISTIQQLLKTAGATVNSASTTQYITNNDFNALTITFANVGSFQIPITQDPLKTLAAAGNIDNIALALVAFDSSNNLIVDLTKTTPASFVLNMYNASTNNWLVSALLDMSSFTYQSGVTSQNASWSNQVTLTGSTPNNQSWAPVQTSYPTIVTISQPTAPATPQTTQVQQAETIPALRQILQTANASPSSGSINQNITNNAFNALTIAFANVGSFQISATQEPLTSIAAQVSTTSIMLAFIAFDSSNNIIQDLSKTTPASFILNVYDASANCLITSTVLDMSSFTYQSGVTSQNATWSNQATFTGSAPGGQTWTPLPVSCPALITITQPSAPNTPQIVQAQKAPKVSVLQQLLQKAGANVTTTSVSQNIASNAFNALTITCANVGSFQFSATQQPLSSIAALSSVTGVALALIAFDSSNNIITDLRSTPPTAFVLNAYDTTSKTLLSSTVLEASNITYQSGVTSQNATWSNQLTFTGSTPGGQSWNPIQTTCPAIITITQPPAPTTPQSTLVQQAASVGILQNIMKTANAQLNDFSTISQPIANNAWSSLTIGCPSVGSIQISSSQPPLSTIAAQSDVTQLTLTLIACDSSNNIIPDLTKATPASFILNVYTNTLLTSTVLDTSSFTYQSGVTSENAIWSNNLTITGASSGNQNWPTTQATYPAIGMITDSNQQNPTQLITSATSLSAAQSFLTRYFNISLMQPSSNANITGNAPNSITLSFNGVGSVAVPSSIFTATSGKWSNTGLSLVLMALDSSNTLITDLTKSAPASFVLNVYDAKSGTQLASSPIPMSSFTYASGVTSTNAVWSNQMTATGTSTAGGSNWSTQTLNYPCGWTVINTPTQNPPAPQSVIAGAQTWSGLQQLFAAETFSLSAYKQPIYISGNNPNAISINFTNVGGLTWQNGTDPVFNATAGVWSQDGTTWTLIALDSSNDVIPDIAKQAPASFALNVYDMASGNLLYSTSLPLSNFTFDSGVTSSNASWSDNVTVSGASVAGQNWPAFNVQYPIAVTFTNNPSGLGSPQQQPAVAPTPAPSTLTTYSALTAALNAVNMTLTPYSTPNAGITSNPTYMNINFGSMGGIMWYSNAWNKTPLGPDMSAYTNGQWDAPGLTWVLLAVDSSGNIIPDISMNTPASFVLNVYASTGLLKSMPVPLSAITYASSDPKLQSFTKNIIGLGFASETNTTWQGPGGLPYPVAWTVSNNPTSSIQNFIVGTDSPALMEKVLNGYYGVTPQLFSQSIYVPNQTPMSISITFANVGTMTWQAPTDPLFTATSGKWSSTGLTWALIAIDSSQNIIADITKQGVAGFVLNVYDTATGTLLYSTMVELSSFSFLPGINSNSTLDWSGAITLSGTSQTSGESWSPLSISYPIMGTFTSSSTGQGSPQQQQQQQPAKPTTIAGAPTFNSLDDLDKALTQAGVTFGNVGTMAPGLTTNPDYITIMINGAGTLQWYSNTLQASDPMAPDVSTITNGQWTSSSKGLTWVLLGMDSLNNTILDLTETAPASFALNIYNTATRALISSTSIPLSDIVYNYSPNVTNASNATWTNALNFAGSSATQAWQNQPAAYPSMWIITAGPLQKPIASLIQGAQTWSALQEIMSQDYKVTLSPTTQPVYISGNNPNSISINLGALGTITWPSTDPVMTATAGKWSSTGLVWTLIAIDNNNNIITDLSAESYNSESSLRSFVLSVYDFASGNLVYATSIPVSSLTGGYQLQPPMKYSNTLSVSGSSVAGQNWTGFAATYPVVINFTNSPTGLGNPTQQTPGSLTTYSALQSTLQQMGATLSTASTRTAIDTNPISLNINIAGAGNITWYSNPGNPSSPLAPDVSNITNKQWIAPQPKVTPGLIWVLLGVDGSGNIITDLTKTAPAGFVLNIYMAYTGALISSTNVPLSVVTNAPSNSSWSNSFSFGGSDSNTGNWPSTSATYPAAWTVLSE